jgi:hypothetical protein
LLVLDDAILCTRWVRLVKDRTPPVLPLVTEALETGAVEAEVTPVFDFTEFACNPLCEGFAPLSEGVKALFSTAAQLLTQPSFEAH